jgi:transcriptional regulator with XRE-family HTH domain
VTAPTNTLGQYLRARRDAVAPAQAGFAPGGARRVPGLRREEVALLAGISADYYLRIERGRDRHPSPQVLEAIARALDLDADHRSHLMRLGARPARRRDRPSEESLPTGVVGLLSSLVQPAYIEGRYFDVLASNPLARALDPAMSVGRNQLLDMFLDPGTRALRPDHGALQACLVARLRQAVGNDVDDPRFVALVGELSLGSDLFRRLWAQHDVKQLYGSASGEYDHPQLGAVTLRRERLAVGGTDTLTLVVYHAEAGSPSAEKLSLLASTLTTAVNTLD